MPISTTYAISRGLAEEPAPMHKARGQLVKVCWRHDGQRHERAFATGGWERINRYAAPCLRIDADFPAGTDLEIHWE